jgi:hypothetical protein
MTMAAPEPDIEKLQALSAQMERNLNDGSLTYEIWRGSRGGSTLPRCKADRCLYEEPD